MALELPRTLRGALAGAAAAGVWAAQQPLDKRVFGVPNDDAPLLGAVYANVAPALPVPPWARGPLAGLAEHLATWPLASVVDRVHPARDRIPPITGKRAAFWQAAWRHLLFGLLLGELERRLNAPEPEVPSLEDVFSSNGHGSLEHATPAVS